MEASLDIAADVALRLAGASDVELDAVVTETLALVAEHTGADRTYVTLYHDDGTFENSHEWTPDDVVPQRPVIQRLRSSDFEYSYEMARRNEVLAAPDLLALPDAAAAEKRSFSSFGVKAVLQVPIVSNGVGVGLVGVNNFHTDVSWSPEQVEFVRRLGQAIGVALMRQRSDRAMRAAYEAAERANHAKDELLSHVSHELRTPLHAVLGYAELLELDDRSERDRDALMQIQFNGRRLLTMVEDLIELGDATSAPAVVDVELGEFLDEAIEGLGPSATSRRIGIEAHPGLHGTVVHTEPARLRQVLYCSLSGAVQSIDGGGTVTVDVQVPAHHTASTDATAPHPSPGNMSPAATSSGTFAIEMHLTGTQPLREADMIMPMALALIEGHGSIDLHRVSPERVDVTIRFDQVINP